MKTKIKKYSITLIEIMIVILLIGLIGGSLAFNMRGSLEKGRIFKTEQNIARVYDALMMEYAKGELSLEEIVTQRLLILQNSPFVKNGKQILNDAWGQPLLITLTDTGEDLSITSKKLIAKAHAST